MYAGFLGGNSLLQLSFFRQRGSPLHFQSHMTITPIFLQIFCIILFLAGSITFGTVMAQLSEMLTDLNREKVL